VSKKSNKNNEIALPDGGVPLEVVKTTQVDILPGQGALVVYEDGVTMVLPENNEEAYVPQHIMFLIGVYFRSADPAFVELMIRSGIDSIGSAKQDD